MGLGGTLAVVLGNSACVERCFGVGVSRVPRICFIAATVSCFFQQVTRIQLQETRAIAVSGTNGVRI